MGDWEIQSFHVCDWNALGTTNFVAPRTTMVELFLPRRWLRLQFQLRLRLPLPPLDHHHDRRCCCCCCRHHHYPAPPPLTMLHEALRDTEDLDTRRSRYGRSRYTMVEVFLQLLWLDTNKWKTLVHPRYCTLRSTYLLGASLTIQALPESLSR